MLRRNCIGSEGSTHGQTVIYYIPPSHWIAEGIKICAVSNFINTGKMFGGGVIWVFFNMKRDQSQKEKRYFYKICRFFFKFLRICIPPPKKRLVYIGLLLSVRSLVLPVVTLFRLSDTLLNFARTGIFISEL